MFMVHEWLNRWPGILVAPMSFLNSAFLFWLLPLLGLPLLIHLLNKKFPQVVYFPNIEHVRRAMAQRSKLLRWRHIILTILRTAAVLLLLLAFLQPIRHLFGQAPVGAASKRILVIVDHSLSMEYREGQMSGRERAVLEAEKLLDSLEPGTLVNIIRAGRNPIAAFPDFSPLHGEALAFLRRTKPNLTRADFVKANAEALRLLAGEGGPAEVYFMSDFQRRTWSNIHFDGFPEATSLFFVDVSARVKTNRAILGAAIGQPAVLAGETVPLEVSVANYSDEPYEDRVEVLLNGRFVAHGEISLAPWSTGVVSVPVAFTRPGPQVCEVAIGDDRLAHDNRRFLTLQVLDQEEVLLVNDAESSAGEAGFFLAAAINPFEGTAGSLLANRVRSSELTSLHLATTSKLILTNLEEVSVETAELLAEFLFRGGGIILFLDGAFDALNLHRLQRAMRGGSLPFRVTHRQTAENIPGGMQQILRGDFRSPFLKVFAGTHRQNLSLVQFYEYYHALPTGDETLLLHFADGTPAMGSAQVGAGTLLLCNFSVGEMGSNLARQRVFPAWLQEMVKQVDSRESTAPVYHVGDTVSAEVWREEFRGEEVQSPGGNQVEVRRQPLENRLLISFAAGEPGIYRAGAGQTALAFAVNTDPGESDLRRIEAEHLPERAGVERGGHFVGGHDYQEMHQGRAVFHYFVFGLLALLLTETALFAGLRNLSRK